MKIATIEKIKLVDVHPNADALSLATVNGWQVCIKKNEFKEGDLCIYVTVDSILEPREQYKFLESKHYRINTIKLRKQISQGICFPLSLLYQFNPDFKLPDDPIGYDVASIIGASHYEKPIPACLSGTVKGGRPSFIKKTDEDNIKSNPEIIKELYGHPYYISIKIDGSSGTFYINNGVFGVCSRNLELKHSEDNAFWKVAIEYDIENKIKSYFKYRNIAIQGEVYGPGIQKNNLGVDKISFSMFNLFDIDNRKYLDYKELCDFSCATSLPMVDVLETGKSFEYELHELVSIANTLKYKNGNLAEGIVIRPLTEMYSNTLNGRLSGKIVSAEFELLYGN